MRKVTKVITLLSFYELSEKQKDDLTEKLSKDYGRYYIDDNINDCFEYVWSQAGVKDVKEVISDYEIRWSLSSCQGDGVSFTGKIDNSRMIEFLSIVYNNNIPKNVLRVLPFINIEFERNNEYRYVHKYTVETNISYPCLSCDAQRIFTAVGNIKAAVEEWRVGMCNALEKAGEACIDYTFTKEFAQDACEMNDLELIADGNMVEIYNEEVC